MRDLHDLTGNDRLMVEDLVARFEEAWQRGNRPVVEEYLPSDEPDRRAVLTELVHADLEFRLKAGESARVEDYLARYPQLQADAEVLGNLLAREFDLRRRSDPGLTLDDYRMRFPLHAGAIAELFARRETGIGESPATVRALESAGGPHLSHANTIADGDLGDRYRVVGEIARGGMGVVLRAIETSFDRPLAVKVMLPPFPGHDSATKRFLAEARVTGQLQHPGIPPVHEMGQMADGRPFFSMKLIEGHTLAQLLRERASPHSELPRFLAIFQQVAQTLAYAHSQGIIHRDLKPHNVMVGAFGEVQLMDWGLAKRLPKDRASASSPSEAALSVRSTDSALAEKQESAFSASIPDTLLYGPETPPASDALTQERQVLGTLAYLAPEQARGEVARLDERCDVFGLGAILCEVLTGKPPYRAGDQQTLLHQARNADLADARARLQACGADAELIDLARQCLAAEPHQRPSNAGVVAKRVSDYLATVQERLEQARAQQASAEVKAREERKRRRLAMGLAASVLVMVGSAAAGAVWYQSQRASARERQSLVEQEITQAVAEAEGMQAELRHDLGDPITALQLLHDPSRWQGRIGAAKAALQRARSFAESSEIPPLAALNTRLTELESILTSAEADHRQAQQLAKIRLEASASVEGTRDEAKAGRYIQEFLGAGMDLQAGTIEGMANLVKQSSIRWHWIAALDFWAYVIDDHELRARLLDVARRADGADRWRDTFRNPEMWKDQEALQALARDAAAPKQPPAMITALARRLHRTNGDPVPLLESALLEHPRDFWLHFEMALGTKNPEAQVRSYHAAIAVHPSAAVAYSNLGNSLYQMKRLDAAIAACRKAIDLNPDLASAHINMGIALWDKAQQEHGEPAKKSLGLAIEEFKTAMVLAPTFSRAAINYGNTLADSGDLEAAIDVFKGVIAADPKCSIAYYHLGLAYTTKSMVDDAITAYEEAITHDPQYVLALCNLASLLISKGEFERAIALIHNAIVLAPDDVDLHYNLGIALYLDGKFAPAQDALQRCLQLLPADSSKREFVDQQRKHSQRLLKLEARLPDDPAQQVAAADAAEKADFARLYYHRKQYSIAAMLYGEALSADPILADDLLALPRYSAACTAALAGCGLGNGEKLQPPQRAQLRSQALTWLRAELSAWRDRAGTRADVDSASVRTLLLDWQADPNLAAVRDNSALSKLPHEEQAAWKQFWADVTSLLGALRQ